MRIPDPLPDIFNGARSANQLGDIHMAETPQDFTRAEDTVSKLSDKFAANADAKSVCGEPVQAGGRTIILVAKVGYLVGATSGGRNGETLEGAAEGAELARGLSATSRSQMRGRGMWRCQQPKDDRGRRSGICGGLSVPGLPPSGAAVDP
jgi:hypothetical protein